MKVGMPGQRVVLVLLTAAVAGGIARAVNGYASDRRRLLTTEASTQRARRAIAELPLMRRAIRTASASDSLGTALLAATEHAAALAEMASELVALAPEGPSSAPQVMTVDDTTRLAGLRRTSVRLRATGNTEDLLLFLERLMIGTAPLRIDEVRLDVVGQGATAGADALLSMEAIVRAWYREGA